MKRPRFFEGCRYWDGGNRGGHAGYCAVDARAQVALTSSFPKSLDTIYGGAEVFAKAVAKPPITSFRSRFSLPAKIVPALAALDAVQNGNRRDVPHLLVLLFGKDPTFAFGTSVPFGSTTA